MTETRTESVLSDVASIHASQSEISFTNSSPRLESQASSSTACMDEVRTGQDVSIDLICAICNQLFDRPVMVSCGHSFCEGCIERQTRFSQVCIICNKDVGLLVNMIPSITLDSIVRKIKANDFGNSFDDLYICDDRSKNKSVVERSVSTRSKRRCFFSIAGPTVCSSPVAVQRRRPLSPNAKPSKSSLKFPSDAANLSFTEGTGDGKERIFKRNGFGRQSERFTSSTQSRARNIASYFTSADNPENTEKSKGTHAADSKIKRNSILRRSLNAIRSRTVRRKSNVGCHAGYSDDDEVLIDGISGSSQNESLKTKCKPNTGLSIWRKMFNFKKKDSIDINDAKQSVMLLKWEKRKDIEGFSRLENVPEQELNSDVGTIFRNSKFGYYQGIGKKFERIGSGDEICVVIFGHKQSGKTTIARSMKEMFSDSSSQIRAISAAERYRMAGVQKMPYPEGDNRLPRIASLILPLEDGTEQVMDIVDAEYDDSYLPQSYMSCCDAALIVVDARNCPSLLSAHQLYRNLKHGNDKCSSIECEVIINFPSAVSDNRVVNFEFREDLAKRIMKTSIYELCAKEMKSDMIEKILFTICKRVIDSRSIRVFNPSQHGILV